MIAVKEKWAQEAEFLVKMAPITMEEWLGIYCIE